jgi:hypothetical protein
MDDCKWICPICKKERKITYQQFWNIKTKRNSGNCYSCAEKLKNHDHLRLTRPWNKGLKGYRKGHPPSFMAYGKDNPAWKGGITPINLKIRNSEEYREWRKTIFERDNYTCQECGERGVKLHVDHIKPFSLFPDLRFEISNGRTLCLGCHKNTNTYLSRVYNYGLQI